MELFGSLAVLALIDATSVGTLVIPVLMLVAPRVRPSRVLLYLATVAVFYFGLGLALLAGATALTRWSAQLGQLASTTPAAYVMVAVGVAMFAYSFWIDPKAVAKRQARSGRAPKPSRMGEIRTKLIGPDASALSVVGLGVIAALIESASMLPYLAAIGLLASSELTAQPLVLALYVVVMVLPAVLALVLRMALAHRLQGPLTRFAAWLDRVSAGTVSWVVGIAGFLLARAGLAVLLR